MLKWSHLFTLIHTLLHFVTQNHIILSPTASAAASTSKPGVSKSHLLGIISDYAEHLCAQTHMYAYTIIHCSGAYV